ncbi:helix-turn-helix domain-containing protein [Paenibacillus senegalensis]|uniref:helix-turn-helix domain-containing protein n=1 Tax=Paenibacillus senegalensis TaxID=1465766 RepID=UPI00028883C2|nr:helix-turn-helix transcriptional regulator [Paenibacillus senegalensis]
MSVLGNRIKHLREQASLSQKRLAEALGISNVQLSRYETGDRKPDPDTIRQIADYFDVSVDYLLGRDTPSKPSPDLDDPELTILFRSLQSASPEIREETRKFLEFLMEKEKNRKPGDPQGYK